WQGRFDEAGTAIERGYTLAEQLGHTTQIAVLLYRRGRHAFYVGNWATMRLWYERAAALFEQEVANSMMVYAYAPFAVGHLGLVTGDREQGARHLDHAVTVSEQNGNLHVCRTAHRELAEAELILGRAETARARLDTLLDDTSRQEESDIT